MNGDYHIPVLRSEAIEYLVTRPDGIYVDGTLGGGGHAEYLLEKIFPAGTLIGIDADEAAIAAATERLKRFHSKVVLVHDNAVHLVSILHQHHISSLQGILLDLGVSSFQLDEGAKGFSFRSDDRLDMRMDRRQALDAHEVVNTYAESELEKIFREYGEEKFSRKIARSIVFRREKKVVDTTGDLASAVESTVGGRFAVKSLARIFQAIRIEVNNELERLQKILNDSLTVTSSGARVVVIAYHSLEDRIVKNFFAAHAARTIPSGHKLLPDIPRVPELKLITKKPIVASPAEQRRNPRSRSAKMRVAERL